MRLFDGRMEYRRFDGCMEFVDRCWERTAGANRSHGGMDLARGSMVRSRHHMDMEYECNDPNPSYRPRACSSGHSLRCTCLSEDEQK